MNNINRTPFQIFCDIYDEFEKQSGGRVEISHATEEFSAIEVDRLSPLELLAWVESWTNEFKSMPELYFYRGNFFWRVLVKDDFLAAFIIKRGTQGDSPLDRVLTWPLRLVDSSKVVKNLLDIMRFHEEKHQERKRSLML